MQEIIKIIEGFNTEKDLLIKSMCKIENFTYNTSIAQIKEIKERLAIVDNKITEIQKSLLSSLDKPLPDNK